MSETIFLSVAIIIFIGMTAQWAAWKFKLPSIFLLLAAGLLAGPATGLINPEKIAGDLLFPFISLSVALILFEGGMNLAFYELKAAGGAIKRLIFAGIPITFALNTAAAFYLLGIELKMAFLIGAILVVTGPTVIMPLLRFVRPKGKINSVVKWEGIINDPIGALFAILVFEIIIATGATDALTAVLFSIGKIIVLSTAIGLAGGYLIVLLINKGHLPDYLHSPFALSVALLVFVASNMIQAESGLFAVTITGVYLANQQSISIKHIREFKENVRLLLITVLFIILSARLTPEDINSLTLYSFLFVFSLILIVRPASIFLSTIGTNLSFKEKLFISWMAPRGIVAAAVAPLFTLELARYGEEGGEFLTPVTFLVIIITIIVYGLSAMPLAKFLKIATPDPQGCVIVGAHPFARKIGKALIDRDMNVIMIDTNRENIRKARMEGLQTYYGSAVSQYIHEELDFGSVGKLLALTPNKEVNSLAVVFYSDIFGSDNVYQFAVEGSRVNKIENVSKELRGQMVFGEEISYQDLNEKFNKGFIIKSTNITKEFSYQDFIINYGEDNILPLFLINRDGKLIVYTSERQPEPQPGTVFIALVKEKGNQK